VHQAGPGSFLRPKRSANTTFLKVPGEAIGMDINLHMVNAVTDRTFIGVEAVLVSHAAQYQSLIAAGSPGGAADAAFMKAGGKAVGMGVDLDVISVFTAGAGHCLTPCVVYMGFIPIRCLEHSRDEPWKSRKNIYKSDSYLPFCFAQEIVFMNGFIRSQKRRP
jgi:hypothetical protein